MMTCQIVEKKLNLYFLSVSVSFLTYLSLVSIIRELRIACTIAQMEREGGISPRMSPLAQVWILHILKFCLKRHFFVLPLHICYTTKWLNTSKCFSYDLGHTAMYTS